MMQLIIPENELIWRFIRASGPGGQNVNKVSTAAQLHFAVQASTVLSTAVKERLLVIANNRINQKGELVITAQTQRTQNANRAEALARLSKLIERATHVPKKRIKTKPSSAAVAHAKKSKALHSRKKQRRTNDFSVF